MSKRQSKAAAAAVVVEPSTKAPTKALARRDITSAPAALQLVPPQPATIVERLIDLAKDPNVDVAKINALIDANERVMNIAARKQFEEAYAAMQGHLPIITRNGLATVKKDGKLIRETSYVRDVDITVAVRPILAEYGFSIRHRNHTDEHGMLVVTGILSHRAGHQETDEFRTGRDDSAGKNMIQSWGSARAYGKRYTTVSLLNIASEEQDDDGGATGDVSEHDGPAPARQAAPPPPARAASPKDDQIITDQPYDKKHPEKKTGQVQRLWVILRNSQRDEEDFRHWLEKRYGYTSTREIKRKHYEEICAAIEKAGPLPLAAAQREPGEDG